MKMTRDEFKAKAAEVIETCKKYGFMNETIMPYSFKMTVEELVKRWKDYDRCTWSSKELMQDELLGFLPILEHWVKLANEPKVKIKLLNGKITDVAKSTAEELINLEAAIAI